MVRSVVVARIHDGLPLAASMDDDQVKGISFIHILLDSLKRTLSITSQS